MPNKTICWFFHTIRRSLPCFLRFPCARAVVIAGHHQKAGERNCGPQSVWQLSSLLLAAHFLFIYKATVVSSKPQPYVQGLQASDDKSLINNKLINEVIRRRQCST